MNGHHLGRVLEKQMARSRPKPQQLKGSPGDYMASSWARSLADLNPGTNVLLTLGVTVWRSFPSPQVSAVIFSCSFSAFLRQVRHEKECRCGSPLNLESLIRVSCHSSPRGWLTLWFIICPKPGFHLKNSGSEVPVYSLISFKNITSTCFLTHFW